MAKQKRSSTGWGVCKKKLSEWPQPGILALMRELYDLNEENRLFLQSRLLPQKEKHIALAAAQRKVRSMVNYTAMFSGRFRHSDVKRFVDQFEKGSLDPAAVAELLLTDLQAASDALNKIGDHLGAVDHLYATLHRLDKTLTQVPSHRLIPLVERLQKFAKQFRRSFGYGISDEFVDLAESWTQKTAMLDTRDADDDPFSTKTQRRPEPEW